MILQSLFDGFIYMHMGVRVYPSHHNMQISSSNKNELVSLRKSSVNRGKVRNRYSFICNRFGMSI